MLILAPQLLSRTHGLQRFLHHAPAVLAEAAALFRDNKAQFERNVQQSLRGGRIGVTTFPRLL